MNILVTGAAGFIASHLIPRLRAHGHWVRGVDQLPEALCETECDEYFPMDLTMLGNAYDAVSSPVQCVYHLAAMQGGVAFKDSQYFTPAMNNLQVDMNVLTAVEDCGLERILFASSACVYPTRHMRRWNALPLREDVTWDGEPEEGYGKAKLMSEELFSYAFHERKQSVRIVRLENVYGSGVPYEGIRAKAPGALAYKVLMAEDGGEIEVFGDGGQRRQFLHVEDAVEGMIRVMESKHFPPVNLAGPELVSIAQLVGMLEKITGKRVSMRPNGKDPGVHTRIVPTATARGVLRWEPTISMNAGLPSMVRWLEKKIETPGSGDVIGPCVDDEGMTQPEIPLEASR